MDMDFKQRFETLWRRFFAQAELPIVFFYSENESGAEKVPAPSGHKCLIGELTRVRRGTPLSFSAGTVGCPGGQRYLGFNSSLRPDFRYFLSCGVEGGIEGERYKKTPEMVDETMEILPEFQAPAPNIVFKRWDSLNAGDNPAVVICYGHGDILSGLFTLANYDRPGPDGVLAPFAAGCGSIVQYPFLEARKAEPRAILGMFDISARPYLEGNLLTFAFPFERFRDLVEQMEESFLITHSWEKVRRRIERARAES